MKSVVPCARHLQEGQRLFTRLTRRQSATRTFNPRAGTGAHTDDALRSGLGFLLPSEPDQTPYVSLHQASAFGRGGVVEPAGEETHDALWWSRDGEVGAIRGPWLQSHATMIRDDGHRAV